MFFAPWLRAFTAVAVTCAGLWATPSVAAPAVADAAKIFAEAQDICARDGGKMWGRSLCGPIFLVDYTDQVVLANQADSEGFLQREGELYRGVLPSSVVIANTPTEWAGTRWTQLVGPVTDDATKRQVLLAHELFHRIQPSLGLTRPEASNAHLDSFDGRYLLQLEWRALARALQASTPKSRRQASVDALAFRQERYRLFASAAQDEAALEVNEGIAEYTGVMLGLTTRPSRVAHAVYDLTAFVAAPSFVRSFAYATGPAYGLLLDEADPDWRTQFPAQGFDTLLRAAIEPSAAERSGLTKKMARYDRDGALRKSETERDEARRAKLAGFKARLVDGPVLILPLVKSNYQFNPQTLVPLDGLGTIYPTMRLTDTWGSLQVEQGGVLVQGAAKRATVSAVGADASGTAGDGWRLMLNAGWKVQPGDRADDLVVVANAPQ